MKFKIGFTIPAETLFGMIAKFLPIEDLHVEEIPDMHKIKHQSVVAKLIAEGKKPSKKGMSHFKHESGKTLTDFIHEYIQKNPKQIATWNEMSKYAVQLGFNKSSINNAVARLEKKGLIARTSPGRYKLAENKTQKAS